MMSLTTNLFPSIHLSLFMSTFDFPSPQLSLFMSTIAFISSLVIFHCNAFNCPLCYLPVLVFPQNFYGRSGVCLALHITPARPPGWEFSVAVFLVLNFVSFLIIAASYIWMFVVAKETRSAGSTMSYSLLQFQSKEKKLGVGVFLCVNNPIYIYPFYCELQILTNKYSNVYVTELINVLCLYLQQHLQHNLWS